MDLITKIVLIICEIGMLVCSVLLLALLIYCIYLAFKDLLN